MPDDDLDLHAETGITRRFVVITIDEAQEPEIEGMEQLSLIEMAGLGHYFLVQAGLLWAGDDDDDEDAGET